MTKISWPIPLSAFILGLSPLFQMNDAFGQELPTSSESKRVRTRKGKSLGFSLIFGGEYGIIRAKSQEANSSDKREVSLK